MDMSLLKRPKPMPTREIVNIVIARGLVVTADAAEVSQVPPAVTVSVIRDRILVMEIGSVLIIKSPFLKII